MCFHKPFIVRHFFNHTGTIQESASRQSDNESVASEIKINNLNESIDNNRKNVNQKPQEKENAEKVSVPEEVWLDNGQSIDNVPASVRNEGHEILEQVRQDVWWKVIIKKK
jgi:hypothetical protein